MRVSCTTARRGLLCAALVVVIMCTINNKVITRKDPSDCNPVIPLWEQTLDFDQLKISNETGNPTGYYLVPNYIHFIHFGGIPITYVQLICILAAFKNQRPEKIFFHYDEITTFTGKYWEVLEHTSWYKDTVVLNEVELPDEIFGQPLNREWRRWHASDLMRMQVVMKYGGMYVDNDSYIVKSLDNYRKYEISVSWDQHQNMSSAIVIAHKDARFLRRWFDCYKVYNEKSWFYNAGERPTVEVLYKEPELVHRVQVYFGTDNIVMDYLYAWMWKGWRYMHIIHLYDRHLHMIQSLSNKARYPVVFDENNIAYYKVTFREMAYDVYDIANTEWSKNRIDD